MRTNLHYAFSGPMKRWLTNISSTDYCLEQPASLFVLNRCAEDNTIEFPKAVNAIKNHFSMYDYIHSLPSIEQTNKTINQTKNSLHKRAFRWTKIVANKLEAPRFFEQADRDELKEINRVLGQKWNLRTDCFLMKTLKQLPRSAREYTQRKMFS